ncbi:Ankyrin repeat domain-containing protein 61 [Elasticomyces elasticus]|nr:Ankyrin repeat domain-containing protein 61 [Elasticomyces elasticus]
MILVEARANVGQVVEERHATLGIANEQTHTINADHRAMCKFSEEDDDGYIRVSAAIREAIEDTPETLAERPALRLQPILSEASHTRSGVHDTTAVPNAYPASSSKFTPPPTGSPYSIPVRGSKTAPPLPRRQDKYPLDRSTYQRLLNTALAIEGPSPPEKFQPIINHYKAHNQWGSQLEDYKVVFLPDTFNSQSMKSLSELLFLAAYAGDVIVVCAAIHAKADVDYFVPELGDCPLNAALILDNTDVIEALLEAKASLKKLADREGVSEQGYMAKRLPLASPATVQTILKYRRKEALPSSAALIAAQSSVAGMLPLLYDKDFDLTVQGDGGSTALHLAARHGQRENVLYLLSIWFDINSLDISKRTALYDAVNHGKHEIVELLLKQKHAEAALVNIADVAGNTPVHVLASQPRAGDWTAAHADLITAMEFDILSMLMSAGARLNDRNAKGQTPLHLAVEHGLVTMVALLLRCEANVEVSTVEGLTPLHICALGGNTHAQIATLLLDKGASLKALTHPPQCLTPFEVARHFNHTTMMAVLGDATLKRGAVKFIERLAR